jgi:hypothetical protein
MIKRDFILEEVLGNTKTSFFDFINTLDAKVIIDCHQRAFKDYYITSSNFISGEDADELFNDWDLNMIIRCAYEDYFEAIGKEQTYEWLNVGDDKDMKEIIDFIYFSGEYHNEDEAYEFENDLYYEPWSYIGPAEFIFELYYLWVEDNEK